MLFHIFFHTQAAWLEKEIRKLGGRVEYFFGKEVQYLITDKPQTRETVPPCSPFSNPGPSPFSRPEFVDFSLILFSYLEYILEVYYYVRQGFQNLN